MVYEKEIMDLKTNMNLIPAFASVNESVYYVLEDNEKNFSEMIQKIGLNELAVYESTGSVILYEDKSEEAKAATGEKVNFVTKAGENIRAFFAKIMQKISELIQKVLTAIGGAVAKGAHAGNIIKGIAGLVGGGGGGRPNMAQAGGKNPAGIDEAIVEAEKVLEGQIK